MPNLRDHLELMLILLIFACVLGIVAIDSRADSVSVSEDYILLQNHRGFASKMSDVWDASFFWCGGPARVDSSNWVEHKTIDVHRGGKIMTVGFENIGYDPDLSNFVYGNPSSTVNQKLLPSHDYLYDLTGSQEDGDFKQTDEVTLTDERSVDITKGIVMNVSVENTLTIGGEYAGVSVEDAIKTSFGFEKSQEESRAQSESKSTTQAHEFSVKLPAGEVTRISLSTGETRTNRELTIDGVSTWTATFSLSQGCADDPNWWDKAGSHVFNKNNPQVWDCWKSAGENYPSANRLYGWFNTFSEPCKVTIPIDELESVFKGTNAAWQGMPGIWDKLPNTAKHSLSSAIDPRNRSVSVSGTEHLVSEQSIVESVSQVRQKDIPDILAMGAVKCDPTASMC